MFVPKTQKMLAILEKSESVTASLCLTFSFFFRIFDQKKAVCFHCFVINDMLATHTI
jgi:hypothetical protein